MARWMEPVEEQIEAMKSWVAERPEAVRLVAGRFDPWTVYRMKSTGQRVTIHSFDRNKHDIVTLTVLISTDLNVLPESRHVFGISPDDLEECDLPGPDEFVGTLAHFHRFGTALAS